MNHEAKVAEIQTTLARLNRDVSQMLTGGGKEVSPEEALAKSRAETKWLLALLERFEV